MARIRSASVLALVLAAATPALADRPTRPRCGTVTPQVSFLAPTDCDFGRTVVNAEYEDGRTLVVQVVFHVIETTSGQGALSEEHIRSQIDILNEDFQGIVGTPGEGGANSQIEFVLARFDPAGNPTTGINRVVSNTFFTDPGSGSFTNDMKVALNWDPTRYLNIYTNDAAGLLGYATFPAAEAGGAQDGVVLLWESVGRNGPGGPPYNQGRTASHEVGHYLGLFHTFEGGCGPASNTSGDLIADTQAEAQPEYDCIPNLPSGCGAGLAPIDNYMDYTNDTCMDHFTAEQANRMRCSIINYRTWNTKPTAAFEVDGGGLEVQLHDLSTDDESPDELLYFWDFGDGFGANDRDPSHAYAEDGVYTIRLEVVDPNSGTGVAVQEVEVSSAGCCDTGAGGGPGAALLAVPVAIVLRRRRRR
jgi:hypothetical protein